MPDDQTTPNELRPNSRRNIHEDRPAARLKRKRWWVVLFCFVMIFSPVFAQERTDVSGGTEKQVIDRFWDILLRSPRRGTTFERIYGYYADTGHSDLLFEKCRELAEKDGKNAKHQLLLGLVAERRGDGDGAAKAFAEAARLDKKDPLAPFYQGETLFVQGRLREAIDALEESVRRKPSRVDVRNVMQTLGRAYERFGEPQKSLDVWTRLETLFPDDSELLVQIAETLDAEGRLEEAHHRYERLAATTKDEFAKVRFTMAATEIRFRQGKTESALNELGTLLDRLAPESWPAESVRERIERFFVQNNDLDGQANFYRKRLEKNPTEAESVRRLAKTLRRLGRNDEARKLLNETIAKIPSNIPLRLAMVEFLVDQKQFTAAAEQYRELDRIRPNNVDFLTQWGQVVFDNPDLNDNARKQEALTIWRRIADRDPVDPVASATLADLLVRNRLYDEAETYYRRALELQPNQLSYREYLAMFYHTRRDKEKVLETLRPMAEGDNRTAENLSSLGITLLSLGYVEESFEPLRDAAELASEYVSIQWRYVEALVRRGDMEAAFRRTQVAEKLIDSDESFDDFLQREVRFLQSVQKLDFAARELEDNLRQASESNPVRALWRLAVYRQALVENRAASEAIERALKATDKPSVRLLRTAADIFERGGDNEKAMASYENLVQSDGVWRVDHLKRLASLQIRVGRTEQAIETGRLVMGLGSGNASNIRFYADLLLSLGRRNECIDILRQALRVEPGDVSTLALLAETLSEAGRETEAIEIGWRLFERTDNLAQKLVLVEKLSGYYQRDGRFEDLVERLQSRLNIAENKTEVAVCLARVFVGTAQFEQARQVLENRLNTPIRVKDDTSEEMMLRELVAVAERQDDLPSAVRYLERLVERFRHPGDQDRLAVLYDKSGETEKSAELFMSRVLLLKSLDEQLAGLDRMIGREQYDAVLKFFDFYEIHENATWQVPFRRIAVETYLGLDGVDELIWEFRELSFSDEKTPPSLPASAQGGSLTMAPPQPWLLPGTNFSRIGLPPDRESFEWVDVAPESFLAALYVQEQYLPTLFRNRLRKNERFSFQGSTAPPKPFFKVERFADAKFLALAWLLRDAIDRDLESGGDFVRFRESIAELREELNGDDRESRLERLRFEIFLVFLSKLDGGRNSLSGGRLKKEVDDVEARRTVRRIIRPLGLDGETDWQAATLLILSDEILNNRIAARFGNTVTENKFAEIHDGELRNRDVMELPESLRKEVLKNAAENVEMTDGERLDRIVEIWRQLVEDDDPGRAKIFATKIVVEFPKLVWLLETAERNDDASLLRRSIEDYCRRNPVIPAKFALELSRPVDENILLFPALRGFDKIGIQLSRMMPWLEMARAETGETDDAVMETLSSLFRLEVLWCYNIFTEQEIALINTSVEEMRDLLNRANQTPSAHFARRLVGLEEHDAGVCAARLNARFDEFGKDLRRLADFSFELLDRRTATDEPADDAELRIPKPLASYQQELTGERIVDRSLLRAVLQGQKYYAPLSKTEEFFFRLAVTARVFDTVLRNLDREAGFADELREKLKRQESLHDILVEILWPSENDDEAVNTEYVRLSKRIDEDRNRRVQRNLPPDPAALLASALLKAKARQFDEVMPILDAIPLRSPQDIRAREFVAATLGTTYLGEPLKRGEAALDRLVGFRMSGQESFKLYHLLLKYQRNDDARTVLTRLIDTTTDRQIQMEIIDLCRPPFLHGKENAVNIARRVLRNPAFFADPRYFANDAHIYGTALNLLKEYDKVDSVVEVLEARYKGLRDKIDGTILLAELYRIVGRNAEARELVGELAQKFPQRIDRDSDRRAAITKLLQHFGMRKELEEMNERLLAPIYRHDPPP